MTEKERIEETEKDLKTPLKDENSNFRLDDLQAHFLAKFLVKKGYYKKKGKEK